MAGYQNKLGFSGNKLDSVLNDYDWKSTPKNISFAIDAEWTGTEEDGVYPRTGEEPVDNFPIYSGPGDYQEIGTILHFTFLGRAIYAQIQSKMVLNEDIIYFIPFIGQDTSSVNHQYTLKIRRRINSTESGATAFFQVVAMHPIS